MHEESHSIKREPSGWETPENVEKIISAAPDIIRGIMGESQGTNKAAIEASNAMHRRAAVIAGLITVGAIACAVVAAWRGDFNAMEKIIIPLISFAGGFGLAAGVRK